MTRFTKCLLAGSLTGLLIGAGTSLLGNIALPLGAVCFGLFLTSKMLERETALYDQEQEQRMRLALGNGAHPIRQPGSAPGKGPLRQFCLRLRGV